MRRGFETVTRRPRNPLNRRTLGPQQWGAVPREMHRGSNRILNLIPGNFETGWPSYSSYGTFSTSIVSTGVARVTNGNADYSGATITIPVVPGQSYDLRLTNPGTGTASGFAAFNFGGTEDQLLGTGSINVTRTAINSTITLYLSTNSNTNAVYTNFSGISITRSGVSEASLIVEKAVQARLTGLRFDIHGQTVFPTFGTYDYSVPDPLYAACVAAGLRMCACLNTTPQWASGSANGHTYPSSGQLANYVLSVRNAVARYPLIEFWEINNEQNVAGFNSYLGSGNSVANCAAEYMKQAKALAIGIRAERPSAIVVSCGLTGPTTTVLGSYITPADYLNACYADAANPMAGVFDMHGYHPYSRPEDPSSSNSWNGWEIMESQVRAIHVANGEGRKPIFATEFGFPTGGTGGLQVTEGFAGTGVSSAYYLGATVDPWLFAVAHYTMFDYPPSNSASTDTEDYYGLYRLDGSYTAKPSVTSVKAIASLG